MHAVQIKGEELIEMIDGLSKETQKELKKLFTKLISKSPYQVGKNFVENYDEENSLDTLTCKIISDTILKFNKDLEHECENSNSTCLNGEIMFKVAIKSLRKIASEMEEAVQDFKKECA